MNIADGGLDIFVTEQLLEGDQIGAIFDGMGGKRMAQTMCRNELRQARRPSRQFECPLRCSF